jgi:aminoglycoside phosphotransferase (APT) family kinase protein
LREKWSRAQAVLEPRRSSIEALARQAFPAAEVTGVESAFGGLANTNFRLALSAPAGAGQVLLRYWQRDKDQAAKEIALLSFVAQRVPVPVVLASGDSDPDFGLPFAFMQWIEGERLEELAPRLAPASLERVGGRVGAALAAIHGFAFHRQGFFGADLVPRDALDMDMHGLMAWLEHCLRDGPGGARLGAALTGALFDIVARDGHQLGSAWATQPTLTHSDFNGSNILIGRAPDGDWRVAAILDWEFAFAGGPSFDFGNLLRPPLGDDQAFIAAVTAGYAAAGKALPEDWPAVSRLADLLSWVDFVSQPYCGPGVLESARFMIGRIIGG